MIELILTGKRETAQTEATPGKMRAVAELPAVTITDLDGNRLTREDLAGRVVLVEMWATWCPPCRGTLGWLGQLKKRYGDRLAVVALAVQSDEASTRKLVTQLRLPLVWAMGTPDLLKSFGDVSAVPTLFVFDRTGRSAGTFYGAPPELHADLESKLASLFSIGKVGLSRVVGGPY